MKIIIIGAGPAGMAAAIAAAQNPDNDVTVLEKNDIPGKKLLISGSGRCNVTNGIQIEEFFSRYGGRDRFVKPALLSFTNRDLMNFFDSRRVRMTTMENGKVFPRSERSRDVHQALPCISMTLRRGERKVVDFSGDVLITHTGFSGPGILDNSRFMSPGDKISICWVDTYTAVKLDKIIIETLEQAGKKTI